MDNQPVPNPQSQVKDRQSKTRRVATFIFGTLLLLFSLSIVQGQVTHSWDVIGVIMILFFGLIGVLLMLSSIVQKKQ